MQVFVGTFSTHLGEMSDRRGFKLVKPDSGRVTLFAASDSFSVGPIV